MLFYLRDLEEIKCEDLSLADYINVNNTTFVPHSAGRWSSKRFQKATCPIVERLTCAMMYHGRNTGKKMQAMRIVEHTFDLVHLFTGDNPIQVLVNAVQNCGAREDSTRVGRGGVARRQAVDVAPMRRVNQSLYLITNGARNAAFRNIKTIAECLCEEIIAAAQADAKSYAIKKKDELERIAVSNR